MNNVNEQIEMIRKGTIEIIGEEGLKEKIKVSLETKTPLIVKLGLDPSAPDIHLGHTVVLRKIKQLQDFGHEAVIIIGDFTGMIGDPTGKSKTRKQLTRQQVLENAETYKIQIFKVLDPEKTKVCFNGDWLGKLDFRDIIDISSKHTVARMMERDSFKKRFTANQPIGIHEFFYPLMQGYDSVHLKSDIEIGGTEQRFNILMGRTMQEQLGHNPQAAIFLPLLEGVDGEQKMSKSLGNYIGIDENAEVMYEKVMSISDCLIIKYFELVTDVSPRIILEYRLALEKGVTNPRDIKMILAKEIVRLYHGEEKSSEAELRFKELFQKNIIPDDIEEVEVLSNDNIVIAIIKSGFAMTKSEARRLIKQGGVRVNDMKVDDDMLIGFNDGDILRVGKKRIARLKLN